MSETTSKIFADIDRLKPTRVVIDSLSELRLLGFLGAEAMVLYDGEATLQALETFQPDVVLLDIGMPGMDGYEVARRIRAMPQLEGIKLIALTGWGHEEDRRRSRAAGFDHHLVKPVDIDAMQALPASMEAPRHSPPRRRPPATKTRES